MRKPPFPTRRAWLPALCLLILPILLAAALGAQENTGTLSVTVTDDQEKPLPGVNVSIVVDEKPRVQETDASGRAQFADLPPGDYSVKSSLEGYAGNTTPAVVRQAKDTELAITLKPAVSGTP